jgi:hypothetical protein
LRCVWESSVYIATGYGLDGCGSIPDRDMIFSLLHNVQISIGAHLTSSPMGMRGCFSLVVKWLGHEVNHSPQSGAEIKNGRGIPPLLHASSWCGV